MSQAEGLRDTVYEPVSIPQNSQFLTRSRQHHVLIDPYCPSLGKVPSCLGLPRLHMRPVASSAARILERAATALGTELKAQPQSKIVQ